MLIQYTERWKFMYSEKTYKEIKKVILDNMNVKVDKREGSFINDMVSPVSVQLAEAYMDLQDVLSLTFAETSHGEFLDKRVHEFGVTRKQGVKATGKVTFKGNAGTKVDKGVMVSTIGGLNYITTESGNISISGTLELPVEAEKVGKEYNVMEETVVVLVTNAFGINSLVNNEAMKGGVDVESDEELLARFLEAVRSPITSGNAHHYKMWAMEVSGVGDAIITPTWNGAGTVKVLIIDGNRQATTPQLIKEVKEHIEELRPIGAEVTVVTGRNKNITIQANVTIGEEADLENIKKEFASQVKEYFKRITFKQDYVSMAYIGSLLLTIEGVRDYNSLTLNSLSDNVSLASDEIPTLQGDVNLIE